MLPVKSEGFARFLDKSCDVLLVVPCSCSSYSPVDTTGCAGKSLRLHTGISVAVAWRDSCDALLRDGFLSLISPSSIISC